jgi:hypothetical protein
MEDITYIYELSKSGIPFYIGKTISPVVRKHYHKLAYGNDINFIIIDQIDGDKTKWKPLEMYWINQYQQWGFVLKNKNGGGGGRKIIYTREEIKQRRNEQTKQWNKIHPEVSKKYSEDNKEKRKEYDKQYRQKNRELKNKQSRDYYKRNPHLQAWRTVLKSALKRLGQTKEGYTIDLLGYSALNLKTHLESLFTESMSWDNYGEWHIDHIQPLITFNIETPQSIVNALSNLRPMWATKKEINGVLYEGNLNRPKYKY